MVPSKWLSFVFRTISLCHYDRLTQQIYAYTLTYLLVLRIWCNLSWQLPYEIMTCCPQKLQFPPLKSFSFPVFFLFPQVQVFHRKVCFWKPPGSNEEIRCPFADRQKQIFGEYDAASCLAVFDNKVLFLQLSVHSETVLRIRLGTSKPFKQEKLIWLQDLKDVGWGCFCLHVWPKNI